MAVIPDQQILGARACDCLRIALPCRCSGCYRHLSGVAEPGLMNKTVKRTSLRKLSELVDKPLADAFKKQGFASREIVTRWPQIVGADIALNAEPMRMQWQRKNNEIDSEPGTLVLRVEGPAAIEIQHQTGLIIERVNRFFGWQAVGAIALRQAPLTRREVRKTRPKPDPAAAKRIADSLTGIADDPLRQALGRLGAAVKRP